MDRIRNIFRQTIPIFRDTPIELYGLPTLQRDLPNRTFMYEQAAPYADTLDSFNRISAFLHSGLSWSNYLTTLPPITRKFYLNMPPTHSDYLETSHHRLPTISSSGGCSDQHPADIKTPQKLKRHRTSDHSDSDPESHRPTQQPRDSPTLSSSHPPHPAHGPAQSKGAPLMLPMIAQSPDRDHASPTNTNPPRISPHLHPTQRPIDTSTVFMNGTAPIPLRSHHIIHTRTPPPLHLPAITYPRTPRIQRTRPFHTPTTITYAPSRQPIHHHQQNSAH